MVTGLDSIFSPSRIAIVGISRKEHSLSNKLLKNLVSFGFKGTIYLVNKNATEILGLKAFSSLFDLPQVPDLVISFVPRYSVLDLTEQCASLGVKGMIIITAGFRESGQEGLKLEHKIAKIARNAGIRIIGPNSMGVLNGYEPMLNASFSPIECIPGNLSLISQSGALGAVVMQYANQIGLGFSKFVSIGNKLDINANHLLEYFLADPQSKVILCYMESFANPREFLDISRKVSKKKPIVLVKSGTTAPGSKAAMSHTGALAGNDKIANAALASSGIIRTKTVKDMVDVSLAFAKITNFPKGRRIAIVSNAGGPGTLTTDFVIEYGLEISELSQYTIQELSSILPAEATISNPVDILPSASENTYRQVTELLLADSNVDAVIVLALPPVLIPLQNILDALTQVFRRATKPFICVAMGCENELNPFPKVPFPIYNYPITASKVLAHVISYSEWLENEPRKYLQTSAPHPYFESIKTSQLSQKEIEVILKSYGFIFPNQRVISSLDELKIAGNEIGFPLAVKMASRKLSHKSEFNGVFLDVNQEEQLIKIYAEISEIYSAENVPEDDQKILVQNYYSDGIEVALGIINDPVFGHALMIGSGGIKLELIQDISFLSIPFTKDDLFQKLSQLQLFSLLNGFRGSPSCNIDRLLDLVMALQQLVLDNPFIEELDINPLLCFHDDCVVIDARIILNKN